MIETVESLHQRIRSDPVAHLGRKSGRLIGPYELGYDWGLQSNGHRALTAILDQSAFQNWVEKRFGWTAEMGCRQNAVGFALLMSVDDQTAFDLYFELYAAAERSLAKTAISAGPESEYRPCESGEIIELISCERFRDRPGVYLGGRSIGAIWAVCSGFVWAERDLGINGSKSQLALEAFQGWMDQRYPFAKGQPWHRTFDFLSLHSSDRAWKSFYDAIDIFRSGGGPDSLSATGERMLESISKHLMAKNPNLDPTTIEATFTDPVKRICPS